MRFLLDRFPIFMVACATALVFIVSGLIFLNLNIRQSIESSVYADLKVSTEQQAENFSSRMLCMVSQVTALSNNMPYSGTIDETAINFLAGMARDTDFDSFVLMEPNGNSVNDLGERRNLANNKQLQQALAGKVMAKGPFFSDYLQTRVITVTAPIIRGGQRVGLLIAITKAEQLDKMMLSSLDGQSSVYITDAEGGIIARVYGQESSLEYKNNLFTDWQQAEFYDGIGLPQLIQNLNKKESGHTKFKQDGKEYIVYYTQVPGQDWDIFSIVRDRVVSDFKNSIIAQIYVLSVMIFLLSVGFLFWIIKMQINHVRRIEETAFVDQLTGAPTLLKFKLDAQKLLDSKPQSVFILAKFDIDRFKLINKVLGYAEGDRVIINVAKALSDNVRSVNERFARVNIDEFVVLHELANVDSVADLKAEFIEKFFNLMGADFNYNIKFPAGCYLIEAGAGREDIASIMEKANIAHRRAKQLGMELCVYDDNIVRADLERKEIENRMEGALESGEFKLFLQPKYRLSDETIVGAEALVRWRDKDGDIMYPNSFIPLFEENGFILKLDMYIFEKVCIMLKGWIEQGIRPIPVSVNFSRNQLGNSDFVESLCVIADKHGIAHELLEVELTESVIIENEDTLQTVLKKLHGAGFKLAMDDFGTGYSSLGMLKNIPVDIIKIDRSFFVSNMSDLRAKVVIVHIMEMARELGIVTVAEGIETREYIEFLKVIKCDMVQGYYYSKPVPVHEFTMKLLNEHGTNIKRI